MDVDGVELAGGVYLAATRAAFVVGHFGLLRWVSVEDFGLEVHPPRHPHRLEAVALGATGADLALSCFLHCFFSHR